VVSTAPRRRRIPLAALALVPVAALLAIYIAYRPVGFPPQFEGRWLEFGSGKGMVMLDSPDSALVDTDKDTTGPANLTLTYALFLQTQAARQEIASASGLDPSDLAVSGPFTRLTDPPMVARVEGVPPPRAQDHAYRIVIDVANVRPVITVHAQAPSVQGAMTLVRSTITVLHRRVAEQNRITKPPEEARPVLRPLGEWAGGMVNRGISAQVAAFAFAVLLPLGWLLLYARAHRRRRGPRPPRTRSRPEPRRADDWPNTTRVLPWMLAGFLAMILLVPFDAISLPIPIPMDGKFDRPLLILLALVWFATLVVVRGPARPRVTLTRVHVAGLVFFAVCCLGAVVNSTALLNLSEFELVVKKLALLGSYLLFFFIVASVVRPSEVPHFVKFGIGLAMVAALGAVVEYRFGSNLFYELSGKLLPGTVEAPLDVASLDGIGRITVYGSTGHPLELATMLGMMVPFALVGILDAHERRTKLLYGAALAVLMAGALATQRKTSVVAPLAGVLVIVAYRPHGLVKQLVPIAVALILVIQLAAPGVVWSLYSQLDPSRITSVESSRDRSSDYDGVWPDVSSHLLLGRGFQSYDGLKYRILDNEYLATIIGVGLIGLVVYIAILVTTMTAAHGTIRGPDPRRARYALAASATVAVLATATFLFNVLAFPHVPYLFFFIAGLVVALRRPAPPLVPEPIDWSQLEWDPVAQASARSSSAS
jgi:O-antigen ligase